MPRNMSFALTTEQFKAQTKTVTRRLGWAFLKPGDLVNGCEKVQGLKRGERIVKLGQIRILGVAQQRLGWMVSSDCALEGFPEMTRTEFIFFFCKHNRCETSTVVNRIEFEYVNRAPQPDARRKGGRDE